jgi:polyhydroxyalkanoate synthesis regulator phasin
MIERIKGFDYLNSSEEDVNKLIEDLVTLSSDDLKNCVNEIVDTIDYKYTADDGTDKLPDSYEIIFNNEKIKQVLEDLLEEYNQKV